MKGDESKKGQERGARRGPGGESTGGHMGLPRHGRSPSPNPPEALHSFLLPAGAPARPLLLGGAEEDQRHWNSLSWSQPGTLFFPGTASPPAPRLSRALLIGGAGAGSAGTVHGAPQGRTARS